MVESKYIKEFENWCSREHIRLKPNKELFFINSRKTLVPMYQTSTNLYIHLVDDLQVNDYITYQAFANSFKSILVIPKDIIFDLSIAVTKTDITEHFKIGL